MSDSKKRLSEDVRPQLYLGYDTALLYWRAVHEGRLPFPQPMEDRVVGCASATRCRELANIDLSLIGVSLTASGAVAIYEERVIDWGSRRAEGVHYGLVPVGIALPPGVPMALHVLTADYRQRGNRPCVATHLVEGELPAGSFCRVSESIVVTSPELTFLQTCSAVRDLPNIELALELCGTYALHSVGLPCKFDVKPVLTRAGLVRFVEEAAYRKGVRAVHRAIAWVKDGFASPREAELYLLLVLPVDEGGFGLPIPLVNEGCSASGMRSDVSQWEGEAAIADGYLALDFVPDLAWRVGERIVVLEYDGFKEHERETAKVVEDKERRSELAARDCAVVVMTKRDMTSLHAFETKVDQLMRALGIMGEKVWEKGSDSRKALFRWLANPRHDHLPFGFGYR